MNIKRGDYIDLPHDTEMYWVTRIEQDSQGEAVITMRGTYDGGSFRAQLSTLMEAGAKVRLRAMDKHKTMTEVDDG